MDRTLIGAFYDLCVKDIQSARQNYEQIVLSGQCKDDPTGYSENTGKIAALNEALKVLKNSYDTFVKDDNQAGAGLSEVNQTKITKDGDYE